MVSLFLVGEPNCGKTPAGRSYLYAMAGYNMRKANAVDAETFIRVTPEVDFLRGEPGNIGLGDFLDDGCRMLGDDHSARSVVKRVSFQARGQALSFKPGPDEVVHFLTAQSAPLSVKLTKA